MKGLSPAGAGTSAESMPRNGDNSHSLCHGSFQGAVGDREVGWSGGLWCPGLPFLWAGIIPACPAGVWDGAQPVLRAVP